LHFFGQDTAKKSNDLLFYIITPVVIVQSFMNMSFDIKTAKTLLIAFLCMFGTLTVGILIVIPFFNKKEDKNSAVFKYAVSYGNMGYMALPLCNAILGSEGVFYCSAGVVAFNILCFTHGIWCINKGEGKTKFELKRLVLNPGVISVLVGLPLFIFDFEMPAVIQSAVNHIANLNTPLPMIIIGFYLSNIKFKELLLDYKNYIICGVRLILFPAIALAVMYLGGVRGDMLYSMTIAASAPTAAAATMFSVKYSHNPKISVSAVSMSTIFSLFTMPLMVALAMLIG
jgi:predicted permease